MGDHVVRDLDGADHVVRQADWPLPLPHVFAATAGASLPPIGSAVRARWAHSLEDCRDIHTAYSLEAVDDEVGFILEPTTVTLLATACGIPWPGRTTAVVAGVAGTLAFLRRSAAPSHRPTHVGVIECRGPRSPGTCWLHSPGSGSLPGVLFGQR